MRSRLTDEFRSVYGETRNPGEPILSLDYLVGEGDDSSFSDLVPAPDDTEAEVLDSIEFERSKSALQPRVMDSYLNLCESGRSDLASRQLLRAFECYLRYCETAGKIDADSARLVLALVRDHGVQQFSLFAQAVTIDDEEGMELADDFAGEFSAVLAAIADSARSGSRVADGTIAEDVGLPQLVVRAIALAVGVLVPEELDELPVAA